MSDAVVPSSSDRPSDTRSATSPPNADSGWPIRLWPGVLIVAATWIFAVIVNGALDLVISTTFMSTAAAVMLSALLFGIWWLSRRRLSWTDRLLPLAAAIVAGAIVIPLSVTTVGGSTALLMGLALMPAVWIVWLLISRRRSAAVRRAGLVAAVFLAWGVILLVRVDGVDGKMMASTHWRWTPTDEELYLADLAKRGDRAAVATPLVDAEPVVFSEGDWPGFRGPGALGEQEHRPIATNWNESPPKELWRRRVGPSWSSVAVLGNRLYTHEQRGEDEATVCLDADTGEELWAHVDRARFWDGQAGAGPRATPTFDDGRLYTFGATGILNCLDAASGKCLWKRDVAAETNAPLPMWGFSSSPLVVDDLVIVFAGGTDDRVVMAYRTDSGEAAWSAVAGPISYSSAQLMSLDGEPQIVLLSDTGVVALDPATGQTLWNHEAAGHGIWRVVQPRQWGDSQVLVGSEDLGLQLLEVAHGEDAWTADIRWVAKTMRPAYNDFVIVDDVAYGFDKGMFCALDLKTGKRLWKGGRYGYGQVLLVKPQNLLFVLTEQGDVVLLAANPKRQEEIGRFHALDGKTWNHPVIAHDRLYVRNDTEMAAYQLEPTDGS